MTQRAAVPCSYQRRLRRSGVRVVVRIGWGAAAGSRTCARARARCGTGHANSRSGGWRGGHSRLRGSHRRFRSCAGCSERAPGRHRRCARACGCALSHCSSRRSGRDHAGLGNTGGAWEGARARCTRRFQIWANARCRGKTQPDDARHGAEHPGGFPQQIPFDAHACLDRRCVRMKDLVPGQKSGRQSALRQAFAARPARITAQFQA